MSDDEYIGLTPQHEERLRAMATSAGLSPAYRETIGRALAEVELLRESRENGEECYRNAWRALRMIREAVETLGPPGAVRSEEAVLAELGPEPVHEAQAIIEGIQALAGAAQPVVWTRVASEDDVVVLTSPGPPEEWRVEHLDVDGDGGVLVANFSGPGAQSCGQTIRQAPQRGDGNSRTVAAAGAVRRE